MAIQCNEINQVYAELMTAFQDCNKIKNSDLRKTLDLMMAISVCSNGGASYNTIESFVYEPITDTLINYPLGTFHAISIAVVSGTVIRDGVSLLAGSTYKAEFTTLNAQDFEFTVNMGSKVLVELIKED